MPEWKTVEYPDSPESGSPIRQAAYVVIGDDTVCFSGLSREGRNTAEAAEEIIWAICQAESLWWNKTVFYDLQTHRSCRDKKPGEYMLDRLEVWPVGRRLMVDYDLVSRVYQSRKRHGLIQDGQLPEVLSRLPELFRDLID